MRSKFRRAGTETIHCWISVRTLSFYHQWHRLSINGRCCDYKAEWACQATPTDQSRTARYRVTRYNVILSPLVVGIW